MAELHAPWVLLLPVGIGLALLWLEPGTRGVGLSMETSPARAGARWRFALARLPAAARLSALGCLAWVAAAPFHTVTLPPEPREGVALVVALDVSESMEDPGLGGRSKLEVALDEIRRFASERDGDALGLVTFAEEALVRVPPTVDRAVFLEALGTVRAGELGDGTAIGTALGMAANRLRGVEARSRVLVLVSDGRSNAGALDPGTAARAAATLDQHLYVVEVSDAGAPGDLLADVAASAGGRHFAVTDRRGLDEAYREIAALEPSRLSGPPRTARVPVRAGLLWWVMGLLVVERGVRAGRLGRLA